MAIEELYRPRAFSGRVDDGVLKRSISEVPDGVCITELLDLDHPLHRSNAYSNNCLQRGVRQRVYSKEAFQDLPEAFRRQK